MLSITGNYIFQRIATQPILHQAPSGVQAHHGGGLPSSVQPATPPFPVLLPGDSLVTDLQVARSISSIFVRGFSQAGSSSFSSDRGATATLCKARGGIPPPPRGVPIALRGVPLPARDRPAPKDEAGDVRIVSSRRNSSRIARGGNVSPMLIVGCDADSTRRLRSAGGGLSLDILSADAERFLPLASIDIALIPRLGEASSVDCMGAA